MRVKPEVVLIATMGVFAATGVTALIFHDIRLGAHDPIGVEPVHVGPVGVDPVLVDPATVDPAVIEPRTVDYVTGAAWFDAIRPYCNSVDVESRLRWQTAPQNYEGLMYEAACFALAGRTDLARAAIERLPEDVQYQAAGVVFNVGHPAADAGDDLAAGPLMELVVEYWPNHYMALYHAGAAAFERGDHGPSIDYLRRFLLEYGAEDGWHSSAVAMLEEMGAP